MKKILPIFLAFAVLTVVASVSLVKHQSVEAQDSNVGIGGPLRGWAWSSTTGWVSLNCQDVQEIFNSSPSSYPTFDGICSRAGNYKVTVSPTGEMTGWGRSSNVGWIKFGSLTPPVIAGATNGEARMDMTDTPARGTVTGWARACAGTQNKQCTGADRTDGWDGWISLSGTNYVSPIPANDDYEFGRGGVTMDPLTGIFKGFAWGSTNVGWLNFKDVRCPTCVITDPNDPPPSCNLWTQPSSVPDTGGNVEITWNSSGANACFGNGFNTGGATTGETTVFVNSGTTFQLSCSNDTYPNPVPCASQTVLIQSSPTTTPPPEGPGCEPNCGTETSEALKLFIGPVGNANGSEYKAKRNQSFALRWENSLESDGSQYECRALTLLPSNSSSDPDTIWPLWGNGKDDVALSGNGDEPNMIVSPDAATGYHKFEIQCSASDEADFLTSVRLFVPSTTEIEI